LASHARHSQVFRLGLIRCLQAQHIDCRSSSIVQQFDLRDGVFVRVRGLAAPLLAIANARRAA
jgi:hypothetical protein